STMSWTECLEDGDYMKIYKDGTYVGKVEFLKNKNEYGILFTDDNLYADTLVSVNGLDEYLEDMGFRNEHEVFTDGNEAGRSIPGAGRRGDRGNLRGYEYSQVSAYSWQQQERRDSFTDV